MIATFRIARIILPTRPLWCRDRPWRPLSLTCPNAKNLFFEKKDEKKRQQKQKTRKRTCEETQGEGNEDEWKKQGIIFWNFPKIVIGFFDF